MNNNKSLGQIAFEASSERPYWAQWRWDQLSEEERAFWERAAQAGAAEERERIAAELCKEAQKLEDKIPEAWGMIPFDPEPLRQRTKYNRQLAEKLRAGEKP